MFRTCCVCKATRKEAVLHKFPSNKEVRKKWLQFIKDARINTANCEEFVVCQRHFEKRFVTHNKSRSRILGIAYPTLFTAREISSGEPEVQTENIDPQLDHNYSRKRHCDHSYSKTISEAAQDPNTHQMLGPKRPRCHDEPSCSTVPTFAATAASSSMSDQLLSACSSSLHMREKMISCIDAPDPNKQTQPNQQKNNDDAGRNSAEITMQDELPAPSILRVEVRVKTPTHTVPDDNQYIDITTTPTTKKTSRRRIIHKLKNLSPTCQRIYKEYNRAKHMADFHKRAKKAMKFSKALSFEKRIKKMNIYAKKFIQMQINLCTKRKKGRRFSLEEKLIALSILKQGPKCYRFLHKIFILPSTTTLNKMVSRLNIETGINTQFFKIMKKEVSSWKDSKKYCSILFDEMSLGTGLSFDGKKEKINGFVELEERKPKFADHVLVFMARGAVHRWQQTVAYYFCEGATSGPELKKILKDVIGAVAETGLKPIVLACDQGTAFQSALKSFREDTRREQLLQNECPDDTINIAGVNLNIIFDPSHLIKGIRNNFLTKNIKFEGKISTWKDIVDVYKTDNTHTQTRLLHKLTDEHVIPEKVKKMKVKNCVRVLSKTMAAALSYTSQFSHYVDGTPVSKTLANTAETVAFCDDLFDSVNGAASSLKKAQGKTLRTAVRENSKHHQFWPEAIKKLEKIRFVDENGREKYVPTLKNFITTLKSYMKLWKVFQHLDFKIMRPRYFNTDPIENFFGQVRAYNYRNNEPTCHNFMSTYKSLAITRVIRFHSESFNCEEDSAKQLVSLKELFNNDNEEKPKSVLPNLQETVTETVQLSEQARRERLNTHSRAYVTGWVIRKINEKIPCGQCKKSLTSTADDTTHDWISHREYKECKNSKKLIYPSEVAVRCFGAVLNKTNEFLNESAHENDIVKKIKEKIRNEISINLVDCIEHASLVSDYFEIITIRFGVHNWCNRINKILKGVDICRLEENPPIFQKLALSKYQKKLKNKSHNKYFFV